MGMLKKVRIFLGIKYEPLSDPPVIKICEWGPWDMNIYTKEKWYEHEPQTVTRQHHNLVANANIY